MNVQRWRVEDLADETGVSVDTIRFYQKRRLLHPPSREGRIAWYDEGHHTRLRRIRELQAHGLSLALIERLLDGDADASLAAAVADRTVALQLTAGEIATRTGIPEPVIDVLTDAGLLSPTGVGADRRYSTADAELVATGRELLDVGLPINDLLDLARHYHDVTTEIADRAVDLFATHVRRPIREGDGTDDEKAEQLVAAFDVLFPAVTSMVSNHFGRILLERATAALEDAGESPALPEAHTPEPGIEERSA
ncbi:MAG: MerR family transcriptional regulator [Acidimicrobiia bacterium]|nr:MerR family transcriptional regulator [Acidimicrobiia bacterium]